MIKTNLDYAAYSGQEASGPPKVVVNKIALRAEMCRRSFSYFVREFWGEIIPEPLVWNWHMDVLCDELQKMALRVVGSPIFDERGREIGRKRLPKEYDLVINIPPGTTKSTIVTVMFPAWCWTLDPTLKFITSSYSQPLSQEHADASRDIIKSERYNRYFNVRLRKDKDVKSNYMNTKRGARFSTSVGGTVTGMHGHFLLCDDPLNPKQAASETELSTAGKWMDGTLSTRKIDKRVTPLILIMQRLHEKDPSGMMLERGKGKDTGKKVRHICLPGEINSGKGAEDVSPPELAERYTDGLLDPKRMDKAVLSELESDLGQYGYNGQIKQRPSPPEGGMFKTARIELVQHPLPHNIEKVVRYWDKAATDKKENPGSCFTAGVKIAKLTNGKYCVLDIVRGQWGTDEREDRIRQTAQLDGPEVEIWIEQEPGSGGKDSARSTVKNLAGFKCLVEIPSGDKVTRADPFSVQVNWGNVCCVIAEWTQAYLQELGVFPFGARKDQVDASSGGFNKIHVFGKRAGVWGRKQ